MEVLRRYCKDYGITITDSQLELFRIYEELLLEWNEKINLTAIVEHEEISIKHFLDSFLLFQAVQPEWGSAVIDVGTGAGFPGIPLKILRSDLQLTLLDSLNKRIHFLQAVSQAISMEDIRCIHSRAEDAGRDSAHREQYDLVCARAVALLPSLCEYCLPFVKVGGIFAAMKGGEEEIIQSQSAISLLGGELTKVERLALPNGNRRTIILIQKVAPTPTKYPRKGNKITKSPLL